MLTTKIVGRAGHALSRVYKCNWCEKKFKPAPRGAYKKEHFFCSRVCYFANRRGGNGFWDRTTRMPNGCWEWHGARNDRGYGTVTKNVRAHRYAYELLGGPIPEGMCVCHTCDNPPCINPAHLFLGTIGENNRDRHAKGRTNSVKGTGIKPGPHFWRSPHLKAAKESQPDSTSEVRP